MLTNLNNRLCGLHKYWQSPNPVYIMFVQRQLFWILRCILQSIQLYYNLGWLCYDSQDCDRIAKPILHCIAVILLCISLQPKIPLHMNLEGFQRSWRRIFLFQISNNILQSCHNRNGLQKIRLDYGRIAKHKNIWFLLFWLCTDLNGSIHVWTQISPSIATLLCIDIGTTYKHNPPVIFIDCVGIVWIV